MKKILTSVLLIASCMNLCIALGFEYDSKTDIGNGLYKVSSKGEYGIIDNKENVVVSIEFEDIRFNEGKALLIKENVLYGTVDSLGTAKYFDTKYKIHPKYRRHRDCW